MSSLILEDKVAIVTGAAGAIGKATAALLAREGATVILTDIDAEAGGRVAAELVSEGRRVAFVRVDVTHEEQVRDVVQLAVREQGGLDILFNNAGDAGVPASTTQTAQETWDRVVAVNLTGTFLGMKHGIAAMVQGRGGSVINNASVLGLVGFANHAAYSAAKGGVIALSRTAAIEYAARGVRVNCVCPGFVESPMTQGADPIAAAAMKVHRMMQPMGRFGRPEEIAEMVLFLASSRASFMNGAVLPVDGGYVAR